MSLSITEPSDLFVRAAVLRLRSAPGVPCPPTGRWAPWVVPCPISDEEISKAKDRKHHKARMDQRTRERLPVLPVLADTVDRRRRAAAELLAAAEQTRPGDLIPDTAGALRGAVAPKAAGHLTWAEETSTGRRRNLTYEESEAFWAFTAIEVLRLTGIRNEELLELTHNSITEYRLPSTGEVVPLLQVAPSKTDSERLLLVSPELADILSTMVRRLRVGSGAIPLVTSYDVHERVWNSPMPLLFQRDIGTEHRTFTPTALRKLLINALAGHGPDRFRRHCRRRGTRGSGFLRPLHRASRGDWLDEVVHAATAGTAGCPRPRGPGWDRSARRASGC
ncbi:hypothetical protein [Streptomyces atratus]|uniref:hypothetical protein n=1 Tax=Streptomyces atratus TaxID=1893 RepID=UPI003403947A